MDKMQRLLEMFLSEMSPSLGSVLTNAEILEEYLKKMSEEGHLKPAMLFRNSEITPEMSLEAAALLRKAGERLLVLQAKTRDAVRELQQQDEFQ